MHPDYQVHAELGDRSGSFTSTHHGTELGTAAVYRELFGP